MWVSCKARSKQRDAKDAFVVKVLLFVFVLKTSCSKKSFQQHSSCVGVVTWNGSLFFFLFCNRIWVYLARGRLVLRSHVLRLSAWSQTHRRPSDEIWEDDETVPWPHGRQCIARSGRLPQKSKGALSSAVEVGQKLVADSHALSDYRSTAQQWRYDAGVWTCISNTSSSPPRFYTVITLCSLHSPAGTRFSNSGSCCRWDLLFYI